MAAAFKQNPAETSRGRPSANRWTDEDLLSTTRPPSVTPLLATRSVRAVADGLVAASLATMLATRGHDERTLGLVVTATLLGSAATLIAMTRFPRQITPHRVLVATAVLMAVTGLVFGLVGALVVLVPVAIIGPLNPTGGDVSAFLPAEQALIANRSSGSARTRMFARYALVGSFGTAIGAWSAGPVARLGRRWGLLSTDGTALVFLAYAAVGFAVAVAYFLIARADGTATSLTPAVSQTRLGPSRRRVYELSAVFALDSAGGGLVANALVAAWLHLRFHFDLSQVGLVLGLATLASAVSALAAPRLTLRFGLVETMVFTHFPANALCIAAGLSPNAPVAVVLLVLRALLSQLDVPPRQAFVMSVVEPEERSAAAAFTNLPRSLAAASTPIFGGWLLHWSTIGWPLVIGGTIKAIYDVILYVRFRSISTKE